ncbi:MAG: hypothetical protein ACLQJR_18360 [Stellaceae bacterium]
MRNLTKQDVDEAWQAWVATELATSDCAPPDDALTPIAAARMLSHLRFSSAFCDYVLQNEPARIVEVTRLDVLRAVRERQSDVEEWREDWEILPDSQAKEEARRRFAQSHRARMELMCLRHLWLASQTSRPTPLRRPLGGSTAV